MEYGKAAQPCDQQNDEQDCPDAHLFPSVGKVCFPANRETVNAQNTGNRVADATLSGG